MARYPKGSGVRPRNKKGKQTQRRVPKEREDYGMRHLDTLENGI